MTNIELFEQSLERVESKSIRTWANSSHNRPIFERLAQLSLDEGHDPVRFSAYIVCLAIGA